MRAGIFFLAVRILAAPVDFTEVIHYTPPTNFHGGPAGESRTDPGDNPFSMSGAELLTYKDKYDRCGLITFRIGTVRAYVSKGKVVKFLPVDPGGLKKDLENENEGKFPQQTPAAITKISESTAVSMTATRPRGPNAPCFLHFCWIQIETNIVLRVTAVACEAETFKALTNSMQSIKIDKPRLLEALKPKGSDARQ
jgi:hypothetical protein